MEEDANKGLITGEDVRRAEPIKYKMSERSELKGEDGTAEAFVDGDANWTSNAPESEDDEIEENNEMHLSMEPLSCRLSRASSGIVQRIGDKEPNDINRENPLRPFPLLKSHVSSQKKPL